jgi:hypothetical protein
MSAIQAPYPPIRSMALQSWADEFCSAFRQESMGLSMGLSSSCNVILHKRMHLLWTVIDETMSSPQENIDLILTCVSIMQRLFFVLQSLKMGWEEMLTRADMNKIRDDILGQLRTNMQASMSADQSPELAIGVFQLDALGDLVRSAYQHTLQ